MPINPEVLMHRLGQLARRVGQRLDAEDLVILGEMLEDRINETQFEASFNFYFANPPERLPGVNDWVKLAKDLVPDPVLSAAPEPEFEPITAEQSLQLRQMLAGLMKSKSFSSPTNQHQELNGLEREQADLTAFRVYLERYGVARQTNDQVNRSRAIADIRILSKNACDNVAEKCRAWLEQHDKLTTHSVFAPPQSWSSLEGADHGFF